MAAHCQSDHDGTIRAVDSTEPIRGDGPLTSASTRTVRQAPTERGPALQPSWVNTGAHQVRFDQIARYVTGRSVLDVGCASGWRRDDWMHGLIATVARDIVGVDVDEQAVGELDARGRHIEIGDAGSLNLDRKFDVVHAGELIEHLDNPGAFLNAAQRHMRADSLLVLTTPNAFCFTNFLYRLAGPARVNSDHVCWYCEDTLSQLLERAGFAVVELRYLHHATPGRWRSLAARAIRAALPDRLAWNTILVVARRTRPRPREGDRVD